MGTQKSQPVYIIVSLGFPGSWTKEQRSTLLERLGTVLSEHQDLAWTVRKPYDSEELEESTTASQTKSTGVSSYKRCRKCGGPIWPTAIDQQVCSGSLCR